MLHEVRPKLPPPTPDESPDIDPVVNVTVMLRWPAPPVNLAATTTARANPTTVCNVLLPFRRGNL